MKQSPSRILAPPGEDLARRVWIENVQPAVNDGRYPIKRTPGEEVIVTADVFADGHDVLAVMLRYRAAAASAWTETSMRFLGNDRWRASFPIISLEPHYYSVIGWVDPFGTWREELRKKAGAGQEVDSELLEGAAMVEKAAARASSPDRTLLAQRAGILGDRHQPAEIRVEAALAPDLQNLMDRYPDRERATEHPPLAVDVEPVHARFSAWYELFPRSATSEPGRSGTFRDAEGLLPYVARMGFDILYLPPIHPIGRTHRKGRNNRVAADPRDPGSPWAIGAAEGGHDSVHPDLGTLEDFRHFVEAAHGHGLMVAIDIAFQCSPDHPWVREHPEWFLHRPDGTIKYAENPPKKYEDVYPLDFGCREWRDLWQALARILLFWMDQGVTVFRVDNPHTKPLHFWEWLIGQIRAAWPEVIFLAEAFTRPTVMYALAKAGFNQSYTYFTWRNTGHEITQYLTELTRSGVREFFRPNFFLNTPDILPEYLQFGGRPAFITRLVLAATLSSSYGVYSGFELCEAEALPGTEEYRDSEKFQIRQRDWNRPESLMDYISLVNHIRRENPALAHNFHLRFYPVDNEQILCYGKTTPDKSNIILVAVNLDPHHAHEGWLQFPWGSLESVKPSPIRFMTCWAKVATSGRAPATICASTRPRHLPRSSGCVGGYAPNGISITLCKGRQSMDAKNQARSLWYKDAIIYELHVKAFYDSSADGRGDFRGLISKLDYIQELGVNTIWLLPFYPSPFRDDGYDISDYRGVHPDYGTLRDFRNFVRESHRRGLRVITELVINHTSDQHPWFQAARRAKPGSARHRYYVWSDTDRKFPETRIIFTDTEISNWAWDQVAGAYYWHRFFSHQPDLNLNNPQVVKAVTRVLNFWFDIGVDGLRLDAVPYLCVREGTNNENLPETHAVIKEIRRQMDRHYQDRMLLAEANQWPEDTAAYFGEGDECHMAFHFPLMPRIYMALRQEDRRPITEILESTPDIPADCQWAIFLRNHDELTLEMVTDEERDYMYREYAKDPRMRVNVGIRRRLAPLLNNSRRRMELLNSLLFSLPGTPIIYYGDEIGMGDNIFLGDRNGVRTPMQWSADRNAGFSKADAARLYLPMIMDPVYGYHPSMWRPRKGTLRHCCSS